MVKNKGLIEDIRDALIREGKLMSPDPSMGGLLGRYEYTEGSSNKFWELEYDRKRGIYIASWGRIGAQPQTTEYDGDTARKKVQEKISKGYRLVEEFEARKAMHDEVKKAIKGEREKVDFMKELKKV